MSSWIWVRQQETRWNRATEVSTWPTVRTSSRSPTGWKRSNATSWNDWTCPTTGGSTGQRRRHRFRRRRNIIMDLLPIITQKISVFRVAGLISSRPRSLSPVCQKRWTSTPRSRRRTAAAGYTLERQRRRQSKTGSSDGVDAFIRTSTSQPAAEHSRRSVVVPPATVTRRGNVGSANKSSWQWYRTQVRTCRRVTLSVRTAAALNGFRAVICQTSTVVSEFCRGKHRRTIEKIVRQRLGWMWMKLLWRNVNGSNCDNSVQVSFYPFTGLTDVIN